MAAKKKSTFAKAQSTLVKALRDMETTVAGMMSSGPTKKKTAKKAKKKTSKKAKRKTKKA